jgi:hypothetical protein
MLLILSALSSDILDPKRLSPYLRCVTGPLFGVRTYTLPDTLPNPPHELAISRLTTVHVR